MRVVALDRLTAQSDSEGKAIVMLAANDDSVGTRPRNEGQGKGAWPERLRSGDDGGQAEIRGTRVGCGLTAVKRGDGDMSGEGD